MNSTYFKKISFVFPCLNEEDGLKKIIPEVIKVCDNNKIDYEIIVVDNGSTDNSVGVCNDMINDFNIQDRFKLVHEKVRGFGASCKKGFSIASGDVFILSDCDGSYEYSDENINNLLDKINEGYDMVVGNRFSGKMENGSMPFLNKYIGNPILSGMTSVLFNINIKDIHSGMRAIRSDTYNKIKVEANEFQFLTEMTIKMSKIKARFANSDMSFRVRIGDTKLRKFDDGISNMMSNLKYFLKR